MEHLLMKVEIVNVYPKMNVHVFTMEKSLCPMKSYFEMEKNGLNKIHTLLFLIFDFIVNVKMVDGFVMINQFHLEHVQLLVLHIWKHSMEHYLLLNQEIIY